MPAAPESHIERDGGDGDYRRQCPNDSPEKV
jgi:hypothetical protein